MKASLGGGREGEEVGYRFFFLFFLSFFCVLSSIFICYFLSLILFVGFLYLYCIDLDLCVVTAKLS